MSGKLADFQPNRLTQARQFRLLTMTDLAERSNLTRQAISQYESGQFEPGQESLSSIARELDFSPSYFFKPLGDFANRKETPSTYRSMSRSTSRARNQAEVYLSWVTWILETYQEYVELPDVRLPTFEIPDFGKLSNDDIEGLADKTRSEMGLGKGPISDVTLLAENHGIVVAQAALNPDLDGLSSWFGGRPFVLLRSNTNRFRRRFDLAHEIGHLVLHRTLNNEDLEDRERFRLIENQAHHFAGAFLMPESETEAEVYRTDFQALLDLKKRWGVSMQAIIMRLHKAGLISDQKKQRLFKTLSVRNARREEPLDAEYQPETPVLFRKVFDFLIDNKIWEGSEMASRMGIPVSTLSDLTAIPKNRLIGETVPDNVVVMKRGGTG